MTKHKTKLFIKKQQFIRVFRRIPKTKIYTLCDEQTFLIFNSPKGAVLNLQGCKTNNLLHLFTFQTRILRHK